MKILLFLALTLCVYAADVKEKENKQDPEQNKDKRQIQGDFVPSSLVYRTSRKQENVAPVEENQEDERVTVSRADDEYRPGQVISLNAQELLDLQPERKAPLPSSQQLQQLYSPQQDHRQNLQQIYYLEPQAGRQVSLQPSHAVIARPHYSANGGEASVGAALAVSDSGVSPSDSYDPDLLALLGQAGLRQDERNYPQQVQASTQSAAPQYQQVSTPNAVPQYQQVDRYLTKPSKKPTKQRPKVHSHIAPPQSSAAPQQYLIETTNVQQQQPQVQQYRTAPQTQRAPQSLRYVPIPAGQAYVQQALYERPETQGLKVVAPPKLQQRPQLAYRVLAQPQPYQQQAVYQQPEVSLKQYRIIEAPRAQAIRPEQQRIPASSVERPVTYLKRYQEPEKMRSVRIYDPVQQEGVPQQPAQIIGEQYYLRPIYRSNEQARARYELAPLPVRPIEQQQQHLQLQQQQLQQQQQQQQQLLQQVHEPTKPPHSAIFVSKNIAPKKVVRPQPQAQQAIREQSVRIEQPSNVEQENYEQHEQSLEAQRAQLPPPKNNRAYTPEEFAALVAAGYAVTPIPVAPQSSPAQSRSSVESAPAAVPLPSHRRPMYSRRHQYLPLRGDDAP